MTLPLSPYAASRSLRLSSRFPCVSARYLSIKRRSPLAFAFDIDGVLTRGSSVLPQAKRALAMLEHGNPFGRKIPYVLMTNGGGMSEDDRCKRLSAQLGVPITPSMLLQAHTVLKKHAHEYADQNVLVLGGTRDVMRKVAEGYGFKNVFTPLDVKAWNPHVWPFYDLTPEEHASAKPVDFSTTPISAIFVLHDPRNWAFDIQLTTDVILGRGTIGAPYVPLPLSDGFASTVKLVYCNPDLQWGAQFPRPRYGQGAFREAFQAVFKSLTGKEYPYVQYGKPTKETYDFAAEMLAERMVELAGEDARKEGFNAYMIGDNPESDIAGANAAGWSSVLVRTGVYDPSNGPPTHKPTHEAGDVEEAVRWAIEREARRERA